MINFAHFQDILTGNQTIDFDARALDIFQFQAENNPLYKRYLRLLEKDVRSITQLTDIPFIPVEFFKNHAVKTGGWEAEVIYTSSGTTTTTPSRHFVPSRKFYLQHACNIFEANYGPITNYHILALLPGYMEREGSSLIDMVHCFIQQSESEYSGFYLDDYASLIDNLRRCAQGERKVILLGVSFALLELAETVDFPKLENLLVMETGGMKGRRKELVRKELHEILTKAFHVPMIHSEYGMTEAMSQAYSLGRGIFTLPRSMKILLRDPNDPFDLSFDRRQGGINLIDLANVASCSFLQTSDVGEYLGEKNFRILGRMDNSDIRGCNLMMQTTL